MGGNGSSGLSPIQTALDRARNPSLEEDPAVTAFLEAVLTEIWRKLRAGPNTYILTPDEFAVFNFFRARYANDEIEIAAAAVRRYWDSHNRNSHNQNSSG